MSVTCGDSECQGENIVNADHSHIQEGQNIPNSQVQPLEHQVPYISLPHKKDEDLPQARRKAWPKTPTSTATDPAETHPI